MIYECGFFFFNAKINNLICIIRAELEPSTRARDRPKWSSSSSSSDNIFSYVSRSRTGFFSSCRARALLLLKRADPGQTIPTQDRLVYTPNPTRPNINFIIWLLFLTFSLFSFAFYLQESNRNRGS